ncbi:hypothetical protein PAECIP111890_00615 [Paenibacillus sp. JJ-223]|nr:hypothetical protein PAECIP111890_00615 [Paenibacillus sp. JJ-223]
MNEGDILSCTDWTLILRTREPIRQLLEYGDKIGMWRLSCTLFCLFLRAKKGGPYDR